MTLEQLAELIPNGNGPMKIRYLRRIQPPAGGLSEKQLDQRAQSAADWLRGYMHCLADQGKITEAQFSLLWEAIESELQPR